MEIKYLKSLRDYPARMPNSSGYKAENKPLPVSEIERLEGLYNEGKPFPVALREVLFLAGSFCYVLDYGLNYSQETLQEKVRSRLSEKNLSIDRPFYVIDVYNFGDQFLFVYLDESQQDPAVYEAHYYYEEDDLEFIHMINERLSAYIARGVEKVKNGINPF